MARLDRVPLGLLFAATVISLGAVLVADALVNSGFQSDIRYTIEVQEDRLVGIDRVRMSTGDVVSVYYQLDVGAPFIDYDFYVVEGGEGEMFLGNQTPPHVYREVSGLRAGENRTRGPVFVEKPATPTGADPRFLDLVWIMRFDPAQERPSTEEGREYFEKWARIVYGSAAPTAGVAPRAAVRFHEAAVPAIYVLGAAAVVLAACWLRRLFRPFATPAEGAEGSLGLVELGGRSLRFVRALLFGAALPTLYLGVMTLAIVEAIAGDSAGPSEDWQDPLIGAVFLIFALVGVSWVVLATRTQRAYRRWRRLMAERPPMV